MRLEHVGIAVDDARNAAQLFETLFGAAPYKAETVEREGVRTHFIAAGTAKLELLEALDPDSPVARYLAKRGPGLHHLAFEVEDIHAHMQRLRDAGFTPLSDTPRPGADGKLIFFLHPKETEGILVEFCQSVPQPLEAAVVPWAGGDLTVYRNGKRSLPALLVLAGDRVLQRHEALLRRLEMHLQVLAFESNGGERPEAALAVLDACAVGRTHLLGFGTGINTALAFARNHPDRTERLVLMGVPEGSQPQHPALVVAVGRDEAAALAHLRDTWPDAALVLLPDDTFDYDVLVPLLHRHLTE